MNQLYLHKNTILLGHDDHYVQFLPWNRNRFQDMEDSDAIIFPILKDIGWYVGIFLSYSLISPIDVIYALALQQCDPIFTHTSVSPNSNNSAHHHTYDPYLNT